MVTQLIYLIETYDFLYDKTAELYKDKVAHETAWKEISEHLNTSVDDCKKKWVYIRQQYCKYLQEEINVSSGKASQKRNVFPFRAEMEFLRKHVKKRRIFGAPQFHFKKSSETSNDSELDIAYCSNRKDFSKTTINEPNPNVDMYETMDEALIDQNIDINPDEDMLASSMSDSNTIVNTETEDRPEKKCESNKRKSTNKNHESLLEKKIMLALDTMTHQDKDVEILPPDVKHFINLIGSQLATVTEINKRMHIMLKISKVLSDEFQY